MIDKNSPLFPQYYEECIEVAKHFDALREEIRAKDPDYRGRDRAGINELHKEENARLKNIWKKYGFL